MVLDPVFGSPVVIHDQTIAQVNSSKYLVTHTDRDLMWKTNVEVIYLKYLDIISCKISVSACALAGMAWS